MTPECFFQEGRKEEVFSNTSSTVCTELSMVSTSEFAVWSKVNSPKILNKNSRNKQHLDEISHHPTLCWPLSFVQQIHAVYAISL
jgi:hypothetical protein